MVMTELKARRRSLTILGATGSVGRSTLDVVGQHPGEYSLHALTAHKSSDELLRLCQLHEPSIAVLSGTREDPELRRRLREAGCRTELLFGEAGLLQAVEGCDTVMAAIVGAAGLAPPVPAARRSQQRHRLVSQIG